MPGTCGGGIRLQLGLAATGHVRRVAGGACVELRMVPAWTAAGGACVGLQLGLATAAPAAGAQRHLGMKASAAARRAWLGTGADRSTDRRGCDGALGWHAATALPVVSLARQVGGLLGAGVCDLCDSASAAPR
jgi:hypothetical protein